MAEHNNRAFGYGGFNKPRVPQPGEGRAADSPKFATPRNIRCTQFFWLRMLVPFTSTVGEQKQAATLVEQFPLLIRGAWTNLAGPRVRFVDARSGIPISTLEVPLLGLSGMSNLCHPMMIWKRPYWLASNNQFRGSFINDGGEAAGEVDFLCERTDLDINVPVIETREHRLLLDLGLQGGPTGQGTAQTQQIDSDLLIYGALSTSTGMKVRFTDTRQNIAWSADQLPIGAFAGIVGNPSPIMRYFTPYYLPKSSSIKAAWLNAGDEAGKYVEFLCERIIL